jgi:hypothetical protein
VLSKLLYFLDSLKAEHLVEDIIRFLTFSALGPTHTCCCHFQRTILHTDQYISYTIVKLIDPTDVEEIRDKEAELIRTLDYLVYKFITDFRELSFLLSQVLLERWQLKMLVELLFKDKLSKPEREQLEGIGVTIRDNSSPGNKKLYKGIAACMFRELNWQDDTYTE